MLTYLVIESLLVRIFHPRRNFCTGPRAARARCWQKSAFPSGKRSRNITFNVMLIGLSPRWTLHPGTFIASINALHKSFTVTDPYFNMEFTEQETQGWQNKEFAPPKFTTRCHPQLFCEMCRHWEQKEIHHPLKFFIRFTIAKVLEKYKKFCQKETWRPTWTLPWLLRISKDFCMSKFFASSRIVSSSRCWQGQSQR